MRRQDHNAALDGLRGLAAVSVLLFHLGHWLGIAGLASNARLAVDLFFCLSGYVLSLAYAARLDQGLTVGRFMALRLARLWPMIALGTLVSAAYLLTRAALLHDQAIAPGRVGWAALLGLACLPDFSAPAAIGGPQVFALNGPQYTLFFELVANLVWALVPAARGPRGAAAMAVASFALIGWFGPGGDEVRDFWQGFARVFGTFATGVLVAHALARPGRGAARLALAASGPGATCAALGLSLGLFYWPAPLPHWADWLWSLAVAPLLVMGAARLRLAGRVQAVALWLGAVSYPLYALHYPIFVWANGAMQKALGHKAPLPEALVIAPLAVVASWLALRLVDEPARRALGRWIGQRAPRQPLAAAQA